MANRNRTRLYTRWRNTIAPGHVTNDRESYEGMGEPQPASPNVRRVSRRVEPIGETKPMSTEELEVMFAARGFRVSRIRNRKEK